MRDEERGTPILTSDLLEKGASSVLSNLGWFVASLTFVMCSVLFFTEMHLEIRSAIEFTLSFVLLFFASFVMYFSMADAGSAKGRMTEEYKRADEGYRAVVEQTEEKDEGEALLRYCERLRDEDTVLRKSRLLARIGMTYADYREKHEGKPLSKSLPRRTRYILRSVERVRPASLTPAILLSRTQRGREERLLGPSPKSARTLRSLLALLPMAFTACFSVGVVFEWLENPGPQTLLLCLCKLFALVYNGVKGYRSGYFNMIADETEYNRARTRLLSDFLREARLKRDEGEIG